MGREAEVRAVFADGEDFGRLQYEAPRLDFRGVRRRVFQGDDLAGLRAEAGDLILADGARFALGDKAAAAWAQAIGSAIPVTHFLRVVRGSLLKGLGLAESWPSLLALVVFVGVVTTLAMARYRTTLD